LKKSVHCGFFKVDPDIVENVQIISKKLPIYKGEKIQLRKKSKNLIKNLFINKKNQNIIKDSSFFDNDKWEYVDINFLILTLTKATVIFHDKLPKFSTKKTKNQINIVKKHKIKIKNINEKVNSNIIEFNEFLNFIKDKQELKIKSVEIKEKIEKAKKMIQNRSD